MFVIKKAVITIALKIFRQRLQLGEVHMYVAIVMKSQTKIHDTTIVSEFDEVCAQWPSLPTTALGQDP